MFRGGLIRGRSALRLLQHSRSCSTGNKTPSAKSGSDQLRKLLSEYGYGKSSGWSGGIGSGGSSGTTGNSYEALRETIRRLDSSMQYKEYHTLRWSVGLGGVLFMMLYIFRDDVRSWFGTTSAEITSRTLGDESVQREAQNLAQGVVYQLLNDAHALRLTTEFLNQLMEREHTRRAVLDLLRHVASRPETKVMFQDLFIRILNEPGFVEETSKFVQDILGRESTRLALQKLFKAMFEDPASQEMMATFFQSVFQTETFRHSTYELAQATSHSMLNDPELYKHSVMYVQGVLGEPQVHSKAGDAIWGALTSTFVPGFLGGGKHKQQQQVDVDQALQNLVNSAKRPPTPATPSSSSSDKEKMKKEDYVATSPPAAASAAGGGGVAASGTVVPVPPTTTTKKENESVMTNETKQDVEMANDEKEEEEEEKRDDEDDDDTNTLLKKSEIIISDENTANMTNEQQTDERSDKN